MTTQKTKIKRIWKNWEIGEDGDVFCEGNCIAKVCGAPEGLPEARAAARLTAAAPVLLEACKSFAEEWTHFCEHVDFGRSNLDARAIRFMNEVPGKIGSAIALAEKTD